MHYLIAAVILVLSVMGVAWVVAAVAAAIAVPSIVALRPVHAMLGPGPAMSGLYVVLHGVIGALIGLWLGGRGAATAHCPPRPVSGSPPRGRATFFLLVAGAVGGWIAQSLIGPNPHNE